MLDYRLEDRSESVLGKSKTSKCIRVLVVVVVVRAAAAARYLRHAKSTYMASYIFKVLEILIPKTPPCVGPYS